MPLPESMDPGLRDDTLRRSFMARLQVAQLQGAKLVEEYQNNVAQTLLSAGITLIPSDHLLDNQFVVSRGIYEAAKRIAKV